jgi:4-amino-4-deoxy-L-arabinose transferase-like glycosyltransferase
VKQSIQPRELKKETAFWLSLVLFMVAAIALRARLLNSFPLSPDEGIHLMWLRLLSAGYQPYREVYITYPPLYPLAIEAVWKVWPTEAVQRWFSVAYTLFGALGITLLARKFSGMVAGLAAAALTLFSPPLVETSRAVLGEFPSVAWSVWAVWLAWLSRDAKPGRAILLILSGLCLAASLLTKLLSPFVAILILLIIANQRVRKDHIKSLLTDLLLWGLALLLPIVILISIYDISPLVSQVIEQRLAARAAYTEDDAFWLPRYERGMMFVREDTALVVLALVGMGIAWLRRQKDLWMMLTWLGLALLMLAVHNPIRYKHFLILIPPLAIFGGAAVTYWISELGLWLSELKKPKPKRPEGWANQQFVQKPFGSASRKIVMIGGLILLIGFYLWQIPAALTLWRARAGVPQPPTDEVEALAFIDEITAPNDCLITDDTQLVYWSGRMVPPELAEVSANRLKSGALTLEELIEISDRYDCQLVAAVSNRLPKYLPDYMAWVKQKYLGRFHYGEDDLFFAKIDTDPNPATQLWADFSGQIIFHGYTLSQDPTFPGDRLPLILIWQARVSLETDYAIFVQLRDDTGTILASADHQPYKGLVPTSVWPEGAVIQEMTWLHLPADVPPGQYNLYVGLYRPDTLERLSLVDDVSGESALILGPVFVQ